MANERGRTLRDRMACRTPPQISVNGLKLAGTVLMALYFFSAAVVQNGILHVTEYTAEQLNQLLAGDGRAMLWAGVGAVGSVAGVMGAPIFAYLLVQGVEHTSSLQRYILTVLAFAVVSEAPYDLAMSGRVWDWSEQNSPWTVFVALVMLWLMQIFQGSIPQMCAEEVKMQKAGPKNPVNIAASFFSAASPTLTEAGKRRRYRNIIKKTLDLEPTPACIIEPSQFGGDRFDDQGSVHAISYRPGYPQVLRTGGRHPGGPPDEKRHPGLRGAGHRLGGKRHLHARRRRPGGNGG